MNANTEQHYQSLLNRHESLDGSDVHRILEKEKMMRILADSRERALLTLLAKKKRGSAKKLVRALTQVHTQKWILEAREIRRQEIKNIMTVEARIKAHKIEKPDAGWYEHLTEEECYFIFAYLSMTISRSNGKWRRSLSGYMEQLCKNMSSRWFATDIQEVTTLIALIPEQERKAIEKKLIRAQQLSGKR